MVFDISDSTKPPGRRGGKIPEDISIYILSNFLNEKDIFNLILSNISKDFIEIIKDDKFFVEYMIIFKSNNILKSKRVSFNDNYNFVKFNDKYIDMIHTLEISIVTKYILSFILEFNHLKVLKINDDCYFSDKEMDLMLQILDKNTQLSVLKFPFEFESLKDDGEDEDDVNLTTSLFNQHVTDILLKYNNLKSFTFISAVIINTNFLKKFLDNNRNLKRLFLSECVIDIEMFNYISNIPLKSLQINLSKLDRKNKTEKINKLNDNLSYLEIVGKNINDLKLVPSNLKGIDIGSHLPHFNADLFSEKFNRLEEITIEVEIDFKKEQLFKIIDKNSCLKSIHLYNVKDFEIFYSMGQILDKCSFLKSLHLYGMNDDMNIISYEEMFLSLSEIGNKKYILNDLIYHYMFYSTSYYEFLELGEKFLKDIADHLPKLENLNLDIIAGIDTINYVFQKCKMLQRRYFHLLNYRSYAKNSMFYDEKGYRDVEHYSMANSIKNLKPSNGQL